METRAYFLKSQGKSGGETPQRGIKLGNRASEATSRATCMLCFTLGFSCLTCLIISSDFLSE